MFTPGDKARAAGQRGGNATARKTLTVERAEAAFGPLDTVEDAQRRLERLSVWATAGLLSGSVGGVAVRAVEVWLRAHETQLTTTDLDTLRKELDRLKAAPDVAVVTNFSPNHLDRHKTLGAYRLAKQSILRWQASEQVAILNGGEADVRQWPTGGRPW